MIGLKETGLDLLIQKGYQISRIRYLLSLQDLRKLELGLSKKTVLHRKAAGEIHTDFEKGFIRAETSLL